MLAQTVQIITEYTASTPWYHFWNPKSGALGGLIAGFSVGLFGVFVLPILRKWLGKLRWWQ